MERWSGKVALVTGASGGIGAAVAEELAKNGLEVVGLARRVEKVEELKKKLSGAAGQIHPFRGDVSREEDILQAFDWIKNKFGTIHVLVNNAGIWRLGTLLSGDPKHWREVLDVNVLGLSICTQQAFKLMKSSGVDDGHIVHINSIAGHGVPYSENPIKNVYQASKNAVTALTETLRQELRFLKSKIRITSISPGLVDTDIFEAGSVASVGSYPEDLKETISAQPALRSKDIADAVIYVLSAPAHVQVHELIIKPVGERV